VKRKDLRAELLLAEEEARNKKRKAEGKPPLPVENGPVDEEAIRGGSLLQDALDLDKDDEEEEDNDKKGDEDKDEESEEDSDDDEDDTAELLRELEKNQAGTSGRERTTGNGTVSDSSSCEGS